MMTDTPTLEKRGLLLSIGGAVFMAALGIGFAILTSSDAVLLDGLFSLVGFVVGVVALRVATLVMRPDDDVFHFGYAAYEPMLNLTKGLLMAFIALFALVSSIAEIVHGGREVQAGWASIYAVIAASGCFAIALIQWDLSRKTKSPLLEVDSKNWLVDGVLSIAVAVAFTIAHLLAGTGFAHLLRYTDSVVVIVLVVISFPIPVMIIRDNWNQLLGRAPDETLQCQAREAVATAFGQASPAETKMRMQRIGRYTYVQLYVVYGKEPQRGLSEFDQCRGAVADALSGPFEHLALDVIFTADPRWVAASVGKVQETELLGKSNASSADKSTSDPADHVDKPPSGESETVSDDGK